MKLKTNRAVMVLACLIAACGIAQAAESAGQGAGHAPGVIQRVKQASARAFDATRHGIQRGAEAAVHGVKRGAQASDHGIETGAHAVGCVAHRLADKF